MPLTPSQQQTLLVLEVGDTPDTRLATNVAGIWDDYADKALIDPRLQVFYTKRRLIELALGYFRDQVDFQVMNDVSMKMDQRTQHLALQYKAAEDEITSLQLRAQKRRTGASTPLTTTAPISPPDPGTIVVNPVLDANDPVFAGSPYYRDGFTSGEVRP